MNEETQTDGAAEAEPLPPPLPEAPPPPPPQAPPAAPAVTVPAQPHIPVGGIGATGRPGVPPTSRRVSAATESTPLFLGEPSDGGQHGPLLFDEAAEKEYGPSRWKATLEAIAAKVFWDGFLWERFAFVSSRGLGYGATSLVRTRRDAKPHAAACSATQPHTLGSARGARACRAARRRCAFGSRWLRAAAAASRAQPYFLLTGLGAAIGVFCGQLLYASAVYGVSAAQHHIAGQRVPTAKTLLMGLEHAALLAAAAFVAGTFWQPVANMMQGASHSHARASREGPPARAQRAAGAAQGSCCTAQRWPRNVRTAHSLSWTCSG